MLIIHARPESSIAVVSDIHIGSGVEKIADFVHVMSVHDLVLLNGDILDLYIKSYQNLANNEAKWLIDLLANQQDRLYYIVGNHDEPLLREKLPFPIYHEICVVQGNKRFLVLHGHQYDKYNRKPKWYQYPIIWLEYVINTIFNTNLQEVIAKRRTTFSALASDFQERLLPGIRHNAHVDCERRNVDVLIHGHTHHPGVFDYGKRKVIDQGSFVVGKSYVVIENGNADLVIL